MAARMDAEASARAALQEELADVLAKVRVQKGCLHLATAST